MVDQATSDDRTVNVRVVQLGLWLVPKSGGTFKSVKQFSRALRGIVHSCTFKESLSGLTSVEQQSMYCNHLIIGDSLIERMYSVPSKGELATLRRDIANADLVLCHCFWRWGANAVWQFHRKTGVPYWVIPHGGLDPYVWTYHWVIKKIWFEIFGRRILRAAHMVICSTQREKEKVLAIEPRCNCVVVRWPIETPPEILSSKTELRRDFALPADRKLLLCLGRLHPMKQIPHLIEMFCASGVKNTQLVIVGPGEPAHVAEVHRAKREYDGNNSVTILPPVYGDAKYKLLRAVDGFVSNSARENFGLAAAEAMASGTPVILSAGNDLVFEIEGADVGWLLRDPAPNAMVSAIVDFDATPDDQLRRKGEAARGWVRECLSFDTFQVQLLELAHQSRRAAGGAA